MNLFSTILIPIVAANSIAPTIVNNKQDPILIDLNVEGGSEILKATPGHTGQDTKPWHAFKAKGREEIKGANFSIIGSSSPEITITKDGIVRWYESITPGIYRFRVKAELEVLYYRYRGESKEIKLYIVGNKEVFNSNFASFVHDDFEFQEYGAFESKYHLKNSEAKLHFDLNKVDFECNKFVIYANFNRLTPRLGNGAPSGWVGLLGNINFEISLNEHSGEKYEGSLRNEAKVASTINSLQINANILRKMSNDEMSINFSLEGHYYSPNVFEPRSQWCTWDSISNIIVYQTIY